MERRLLGKLWEKQPTSQAGATERNIWGSGAWVRSGPGVLDTQGEKEPKCQWRGLCPSLPSIPQHALDLSLCLLFSCFFLPTALLSTRPLAIKERSWRLMRGLKPFSFPSPCKPTPVHPSCVHSPGFDWKLYFTWWKELTWMANLGVHSWNQPHAGERLLPSVHMSRS